MKSILYFQHNFKKSIFDQIHRSINLFWGSLLNACLFCFDCTGRGLGTLRTPGNIHLAPFWYAPLAHVVPRANILNLNRYYFSYQWSICPLNDNFLNSFNLNLSYILVGLVSCAENLLRPDTGHWFALENSAPYFIHFHLVLLMYILYFRILN